MKTLILVCLLATAIFTAAYRKPADKAEVMDRIYLQQLDSLENALTNLLKCITNKDNNGANLKTAFLNARMAYKKISVLTDYLNPYETILLNNPAIERTEDDNPGNVIQPSGLQLAESIIWGYKDNYTDGQKLSHEIELIKNIIQSLRSEPGRINKFTGEHCWQAMRLSVITLVTKTITSFDTPISLNGLAESGAMLESLSEYLEVYRDDIENKLPGNYTRMTSAIKQAIVELNASQRFNEFNRLEFIRNRMTPLSDWLTDAAIALNFINKTERRPLNPYAKNIFAANAFDIDFFSPNKRYAATTGRINLGKELFNDMRLSANGNRSCAGCHKPGMAFTDGLATAMAVDEKSFLKRNTPTLLNAVYQTKQFYDSRQTMLEFQVSTVVHNESEMGGSTEQLAKQVKQDQQLYAAFAKAYPGETEPANPFTIANAIASYLRSLQSLNSMFDQYMRNQTVDLTASEKNGFNLFMGKAKCGTCHFMPLFNGLVPPSFNETESEVLGVPASLKKPYQLDSDSGKFYFTKSPVHLYAFKTPTLRNIVITAPYMHNGVFKTLEEVIDFYNDGGGKGLGIAPSSQTLPFDKLGLNKKEKKEIISFLYTLTDTTSYKTLH